ncbi:hypothetical protein DSM104299_03901 [Baekduia alba]|nr:hypothetical protein DSM104299_03901 [Baekduia alba]
MHAKALASAADEVVLDLEDAVLPADKDAAREQVRATLAQPEWRARRVAVRVNAPGTAEHAADLALCASLRNKQLSVVVPKVERPADLDAACAALGAAVGIQALIETPRGLLGAVAIAERDAVRALILGYADLASALGRRGDDGWRVQRELLLTAARAAGVAAIDGPFFGLRDARGLAAAARDVRALGFDGKWAIHPDQIAPINRAFTPTAGERAWAGRVVAALEDAGATTVDGAMVDAAMARRARRLLALPVAEAGEEADEDGTAVAPPYYDDLAVGDVFHSPGLTITGGHAALHQAVVGDRLRLALDEDLHEAVTGRRGLLAHPMLVCDLAIGQSTAPTGRVLGNLFYRGLGCRPVTVGTTLRTRTEVVARRDASRGRGVAALRVTTVDAAGAPVLDFWRCPLLPAHGDGSAPTPADDDLSAVGAPVDAAALVPAGWTLAPLREQPLGPLLADLAVGDRFTVEAGETVTSAPELARLSLNLAMTHTDARTSVYGRRLVYGGHVIGIAAAHVTRALPDLATILAWASCDHLGPTFEGDLLRTRIEVTSVEPRADGGLLGLRVQTSAQSAGDGDDAATAVLDWRLVALMP